MIKLKSITSPKNNLSKIFENLLSKQQIMYDKKRLLFKKRKKKQKENDNKKACIKANGWPLMSCHFHDLCPRKKMLRQKGVFEDIFLIFFHV